MTLTELRYLVALARERHFGRAAEACHVAQPTLSVAIRKLEEELQVPIFERGGSELSITPLGAAVVRQAHVVLQEADTLREIALRARDPLAGPLRLGVIHTIAPYLLPSLVHQAITELPQMPLVLHEGLTVRLLEQLRAGDIDAAILAEPFPAGGLRTAFLYDEPFVVAVPQAHRLAARPAIDADALKRENLLLLGTGHCFRDHVLALCPEFGPRPSASAADDADGADGSGGGLHASLARGFEGSSLETIKHMVASGIGVTVLPILGTPAGGFGAAHPGLAFVPFAEPVPTRRVVLAWRARFARPAAIDALRTVIAHARLPGVQRPPAD